MSREGEEKEGGNIKGGGGGRGEGTIVKLATWQYDRQDLDTHPESDQVHG